MNEVWQSYVSAAATTTPAPAVTLRDLFRASMAKLMPRPKVDGVGEVRHPPDAVERVKKEIEDCTDPARRRELEVVLADLTKE